MGSFIFICRTSYYNLSWDKAKKTYVQYLVGSDGTLFDPEPVIASKLTEAKARELLKYAYAAASSWWEPKTRDGATELLRPFFTNNFIYEFMQDGVVEFQEGLLPMYSISDDTYWLLPEYTDQPLTIRISDDGDTATVSQDIEGNVEGEVYTARATTTFVKTKFGWKIDQFSYDYAYGE